MKRILFLLLCCLYIYDAMQAVPAYPYPVTVATPSGYMKILLKGNEHIKYAMTEDGYPLLQKGREWYFASINEDGHLNISDYHAAASGKRSEALLHFLARQSARMGETAIRGIAPSNGNRSVETGGQEQYTQQRTAATGDRKVLVVLVQFKDVTFSKSRNDFDNMFNQQGYSEDGAKGSVRDFYDYVSYSKLRMHSDIIGPFNLEHPMAYYGGNASLGGNDNNAYAMFRETVEMVRHSVNLADYDQDNDGFVDNIHIIFAGYGEEAGASSDAIWSHESSFSPVTVDGVRINRYSCAPELRGNRGNGISRIGPHCHEIGHALGAMDYYDTDYDTGGQYPGTGEWDVMASGSWNEDGISPANFNPYVKAFDFGWCNVTDVKEDAELRLMPSSVEGNVFRITSGNDIFLLENRQQQSFDASTPGHGLLIYHINNGIEQAKNTNKVNATFPQYCYIVCASSEYRQPSSLAASYGGVNSGGCPFPGVNAKTEFGAGTIPAALRADGSDAGFSLNNIHESSDLSVSLNVNIGNIIAEEEPTAEGDTVWHEPFDDMILSYVWSQEIMEGGGQWESRRTTELGKNNRWLQLSLLSSGFGKEEKVVTRLGLNGLKLDTDDYVMYFKAANIDEGAKGVNDITIQIMDSHEQTLYEKKFEVFSEAWTTHSIDIGRDCLPLRLYIKGTSYKNSMLKLDDIVIRKKYLTTGINSIGDDPKDGSTYSVNGIKCTPLHNSIHGGIYIKGGKKYVAH